MSLDRESGGPWPTNFPDLLRSFRQREKLSQNRLARLAKIDPAYVNRMEAAEIDDPVVPRLPILAALSEALKLSPTDRDCLYFAAERLPPTLSQVQRWDPALALVADLLAAPEVSADDLAEFRAVLSSIVERWRRPSR